MSFEGRCLRKNGGSNASIHGTLQSIPRIIPEPSDTAITTREGDSGTNPPKPLPPDDEWAANLRRVVFVPSEALKIARETQKGEHAYPYFKHSPAHVMHFPRAKEEALDMGTLFKDDNDASAGTMPLSLGMQMALSGRKADSENQDMDVDSQIGSFESSA